MSQAPPTPAAWYSTSGRVSAPWSCTYPQTWTVARSRSAHTPGLAAPRTHSQVRERRTAGRVQYAAVYPDLAAGDYTIWRDATTVLGVVTIEGGHVTSYHWAGALLHAPAGHGSRGSRR